MRQSYNRLERWLGQRLESFPRARQGMKSLYQRLNYLLARPAPALTLHLNVRCVELPEPREHFFGYFDKSCWSPNQRRVAYHRVFDPQQVEVCCWDMATAQGQALALTPAWNWQQGAMATWLDDDHLILNTVENRRCVAHVRNVRTGRLEGICPWPIQCVSPRKRIALGLNYRRLARLRPDYGYFVEVENLPPDLPENRDGLWRMDLTASTAELVLSLADLKRFEPRPMMHGAQHKVNHAVFSPDGARVLFMHRWLTAEGKWSRLLSMAPDGSGLHLLADERMVSHYAWRDARTLVAWARHGGLGDHYFLFADRQPGARILGAGQLDRFGDGHPSFSPNGRWLVTDTYPGRDRRQQLLLFDTEREQLHELGQFFAPWKFDGANRCDLHPRWSPDGRWLAVDSVHSGRRALYLLDIGKLLEPGNNREPTEHELQPNAKSPTAESNACHDGE